jgi:drug/metabolite transporter (DMT)-like permease
MPTVIRTALLTSLALVAFAANSLLCRLALGARSIDAASFTSLRVASGALTLALLYRASSRQQDPRAGRASKFAPPALFLYAICFSFAYNSLSAGTGALILFGSVQITMMVAALSAGERPTGRAWAGYLMALGGMAYLVLPGVHAPSLLGAALMALSGFGWGLYSLFGRGAASPLATSARNFLLATPMALLVSVLFLADWHVSERGAVLALLSGSLTSGLGYVVWYAALKNLSAARAAVVQLAVPVIAAVGGVVFLSEAVSVRLVLSAVLILGGAGAAISARATKTGN